MSINHLVYNWIKEADLPDALQIEEDGLFSLTLRGGFQTFTIQEQGIQRMRLQQLNRSSTSCVILRVSNRVAQLIIAVDIDKAMQASYS